MTDRTETLEAPARAAQVSPWATRYSIGGRGVAVGVGASVEVAVGVRVRVGVGVPGAVGVAGGPPIPVKRNAAKVRPAEIKEKNARRSKAMGNERLTCRPRRPRPPSERGGRSGPRTRQRLASGGPRLPQGAQ